MYHDTHIQLNIISSINIIRKKIKTAFKCLLLLLLISIIINNDH